jgi:hypothetical protein
MPGSDDIEQPEQYDSNSVDYWKSRTLGDVEPQELMEELWERTEELLSQIVAFSTMINESYEEVSKETAVRAVGEIQQSADYVKKCNDLVRQYLDMRDNS